jgi:hypothetical protein
MGRATETSCAPITLIDAPEAMPAAVVQSKFLLRFLIRSPEQLRRVVGIRTAGLKCLLVTYVRGWRCCNEIGKPPSRWHLR